jgi:NADPH:quinone reductase-like Zn-dependent oxidoreductase
MLALASGVRVIATASSENREYVLGLGATECINYHSKSVVDDLVKAIKENGQFAGVYDAIGTEPTVRLCAQVAEKLGGGFVATTLPPPSDLPIGVKASGGMFIPFFFTKLPFRSPIWF